MSPNKDDGVAEFIEKKLVFKQFFEGLYKQLLNSFGSPVQDVEDAVAKALMLALRPGSFKLHDEDTFRAYLWRIGYNELLRIRNRSRRYVDLDLNAHDLVLGDAAAEPTVVQEAFYRWVLELADQISVETQRLAVQFKLEAVWEGIPLDGPELAAAMSDALDRDISPESARKHWERGRKGLEQIMNKTMEDTEEQEEGE